MGENCWEEQGITLEKIEIVKKTNQTVELKVIRIYISQKY